MVHTVYTTSNKSHHSHSTITKLKVLHLVYRMLQWFYFKKSTPYHRPYFIKRYLGVNLALQKIYLVGRPHTNSWSFEDAHPDHSYKRAPHPRVISITCIILHPSHYIRLGTTMISSENLPSDVRIDRKLPSLTRFVIITIVVHERPLEQRKMCV